MWNFLLEIFKILSLGGWVPLLVGQVWFVLCNIAARSSMLMEVIILSQASSSSYLSPVEDANTIIVQSWCLSSFGRKGLAKLSCWTIFCRLGFQRRIWVNQNSLEERDMCLRMSYEL